MIEYDTHTKYYPPAEFSTLVNVLRTRASEQADETAYLFLGDGEHEEGRLSYAELDRKARVIGSFLQQMDARGERILLLYPAGLEYIAAFFGCLYAGAIAIPAYPPHSNRSLARVQSIVTDSQALAILTSSQVLTKIRQAKDLMPELTALRWIATDQELANHPADGWQDPQIDADTLAFLQYTSGSTAAPKGVMISHKNLIFNNAMLFTAALAPDKCAYVSWLPLFHDMGLIASMLQCLYMGIPYIFMPPQAFIQSPIRWLQAISRYQSADQQIISGGPNFAYELCVRRITPEQRAELNLHNWIISFCGAEPIRPQTLAQFADYFAPCGFNANRYFPCYGLAEATVFVAGVRSSNPPVICHLQKEALERNEVVEVPAAEPDSIALVGCGQPQLDTQVLIVDHESLTPSPAGQVGEIWVSGYSVAHGYWNRPDATAETFQAYLKDSADGPFMRTGDLGFFHNNHLFITGRLKDLVIIRGRNYYPQDIEFTVERSHPALRHDSVAAFSLEIAHEERLVVVQELMRDFRNLDRADEVFSAIRKAVAEQHDVQVHAIVLVRYGSIAKTSSGKIQRRQCRSEFLAETLNVIKASILEESRDTSAEQTLTREILLATAHEEQLPLLVSYLCAQLSDILHVTTAALDPHAPLSSFGLDSLMAAELKNQIESLFKTDVPFTSLLQDQNIYLLARTLLDQIQSNSPSTQLPPIVPVARDAEYYPLSLAQEQLWFLQQMEPESAFYNLPLALRLQGRVSMSALEQALTMLIQRHEILRTTYSVVDGGPVQRIHANPILPLSIIDINNQPTQKPLAHLLRSEVERPFDLSTQLPIRALLIQLSTDEHILLLTIHHIATDGWSMDRIVREFGTLYEGARQLPTVVRADLNLPALSLQYLDYALWQRQALTSPALQNQLAYWKQQLTNLPFSELPTDYPRPLVQTYRGAIQHFTIAPALLQQLKSVSRQEEVTLFMTLLAAFQVLLALYSGQEDIVVGTPSANRMRAELEPQIGFYVNMLVLRTQISPSLSFRETLQRVRKICLEAYSNQDLPFKHIVEELHPQRDLSRNPLFQISFTLQKTPPPAPVLTDLALELQEIDLLTTKFDLALELVEDAQGIAGKVEYSSDLFAATTIARMMTHFQTLLAGIVAHCEDALFDLPLLPSAERAQLLSTWNATLQDRYQQHLCLHEIFELQAQRTPLAIAAAYEHTTISYQELNKRANQLAHYLHTLGVGPETRVGLHMERSIDLIVGLLGILKAGGAYVPLDPVYPSDRLHFMLQDADIRLVLSQSALAGQLVAPDMHIIAIDQIAEQLSTMSVQNPRSMAVPANLAYVIYTSGSTGKPKGVMVSHEHVGRLFAASEPWFHFDEHDVWTLFHSYAFDFSVWEIWGALLYGGQLVIVPYWVSRSPETFYTLVSSHHVTVLNQTPAAFRQFINIDSSMSTDHPLSLRYIIFGGEALDLASLRPWFERHGDHQPQLINMYGITETTVHVTYRPLTTDDAYHAPGSLIGKALPDLQLYVLNSALQPMPIGVPGELYVGGDGVARGYLEHPTLTAQRFIPHPFSSEAGQRLYKTGDVARYLADGDVEYLGRNDHQIKLRGFRIELGEIETNLQQYPAIRACAVVLHDDKQGNKRLIAYLVPQDSNQQETLSSHSLRTFLQDKLPDYMIPTGFIVLDELPLTAHGKLDRRALPDPIQALLDGNDVGTPAPRTPIEQMLADIWLSVLPVKKVGIRDNFFALGGDSILSIQIVTRANQAGLKMQPKQLFQYQTIEELSRIVEVATVNPEEQGLQEGTVPLSPIQHWFFDLKLAEPHHWNQSISLTVPTTIKQPLLEQALQACITHHDGLRLRFKREEHGWEQYYSAPGQLVPFSRIDISSLSTPQQDALIAAEEARLQASLDITNGPVFRMALFEREAPKGHMLLLIAHHLVIDGVSWRILLEDIQTAYQQLEQGRAVQLPLKSTAYKRWTTALHDYARSEQLQQELPYWLAKTTTPIVPLPIDHPLNEKQNTEIYAHTITAALSVEETQMLLEELPLRYHLQMQEVLLAALARTIGEWAQTEMVQIDLEGHGREDIGMEVNALRTIGWFTALFPLQLTLADTTNIVASLQAVKEQLAHLPEKGIGYGILRYLSEKQEARAQLETHSEVLFNYLGQFDQMLSPTGIFQQVQQSHGPLHGPGGKRTHLLEIVSLVKDGQLHCEWTYSCELHDAATVERLVATFIANIQASITYCRSVETIDVFLDEPDTQISDEQLDQIVAEMELN